MKAALLAVLTACGRLEFDPIAITTDATMPDVAPSGDLIAHYSMDTIQAGGIVFDESGYGHTVSCVSCPTQSPGTRNGALLFDGVDDIIVGPSAPDLEGLTAYTITMWARQDAPPAPTDNASIFSKAAGPTTGNSWQVCFLTGTEVRWFNWNGTINQSWIGNGTVAPGWHHYALVWTANPSRETFYFDGVFAASVLVTKLFDTGPITIGADLDFGAPIAFFNGAIDDIRVYNRLLSEPEIAALATP